MISIVPLLLWFAWKFVPLWYQQQLQLCTSIPFAVVICLKIRTFVVSATTFSINGFMIFCCDLLENSYLCGISNNIYVGSSQILLLWFAWKFVPLWYQQQPAPFGNVVQHGCDLLENSYLCGISNNAYTSFCYYLKVVICLKIRTFVVSATTGKMSEHGTKGCDLLENSYLCGISNNSACSTSRRSRVVICLKIRTFVVSATTNFTIQCMCSLLWFAWKFVPLWYQQQRWSGS